MDVSLAVMVHILERHGEKSTVKKTSKFIGGWVDIEELILDTAAFPDVTKIVGEERTLYEKDYGRVIGTKSNGKPSTRLRVVVQSRTELVTAYTI
jgi:hypothetical protein